MSCIVLVYSVAMVSIAMQKLMMTMNNASVMNVAVSGETEILKRLMRTVS